MLQYCLSRERYFYINLSNLHLSKSRRTNSYTILRLNPFLCQLANMSTDSTTTREISQLLEKPQYSSEAKLTYDIHLLVFW